MFEPIDNKRIYAKIAQQIRYMIGTGKLRPGDMLPPERELAEQFRTSRASIREAFAALEMADLIESRPGVGTIVKAEASKESFVEVLEDTSPSDLLEARLLVEPRIAEMAAAQRSEEDLERMDECYERMQQAVATKDYDLYNQADADFHRAIAESISNEVLSKMGKRIWDAMRERLWRRLKTACLRDPDLMRRYTEEHHRLIELIRAQQGKEAAALVDAHIRSVGVDLY